MSALIIISAAIFLVYMVAIIVRYGFPASVSDSFYLLPLKLNAAFTPVSYTNIRAHETSAQLVSRLLL